METSNGTFRTPQEETTAQHSFLIVDDEQMILNAFERDLCGVDANLVLAKSGEDGLNQLSKTAFAVVVSDLKMPGIDGIRFLEKVRMQYPETARILVTGKADFDSAVDAINKADLFSFITKPWNTSSLLATMNKAVEHHGIFVKNKRLTHELTQKCSDLGFLTANLETEVQTRTTSLLLGMVNALDLRDTETHWHSRRVALYCLCLAKKLGLKGNTLLEIERGALLHDVGKIGVSDRILLKPGKLTAEEWTEMRKHAEYGYRILEHVNFLGNARQLVWQHHERWDGTGYPRGLKGKNIYIGARIFSIIDTYDAITSDRPYRKGQPHELACAEINKMTGTQFDPQIVQAWNDISKQEIEKLKEDAFKPRAGLD